MIPRTSALSSSGSSAAVASSRKLFVHWFRHGDLRLHDNPALTYTVAERNEQSNREKGTGLVPIFCFDPRIFGAHSTSEFGSLKCGPRRAQFIIESVRDLRSNLEKRGSGLLVAHATPEDVLSGLMKQYPSIQIGCQEEVASEELAVDRAIKSMLRREVTAKDSLTAIWGSTLYQPDDLPFNDGLYGMPDTFTPFRNKVEKKCDIGAPLNTPSKESLALCPDIVQIEGDKCSLSFMPTLSDLGYTEEHVKMAQSHDDRGVMHFVGGESVALARVKDYIWDKDLLKNYFNTRNGMIGADYSTKFSPWLAHGCLSPRHVAKECSTYEQKRVANKSTYWVVFELLWRDFFKCFAKKHGNAVFHLDGTLGRDAHGTHPNSRRWGLDRRTVDQWKEGRTGYPLVDANMRELLHTGFMSNRGRQNVCSFLALDTNTDWRYGADHFEQELLDYDIYSNWGNWCAGAGMTGGRLNRFNIVKQSKDYDCDGDYVRHWCPELKDVPTSLVHEPWKMTEEEQEKYGVKLGRDYPKPIVKPFVPSARKNDNSNGGRSGGRRGKSNGAGRGNFGKGQRKEMSSLKQGSYNIN